MEQLKNLAGFLHLPFEFQPPELLLAALILAAVALGLLMLPFRRLSVIAVAVAGVAASLLWSGAEHLVVAVVMLGAVSTLAIGENVMARRRLADCESQISVLKKIVKELEITRERQQSFMARQAAKLPTLPQDATLAPAHVAARGVPEGPVSRVSSGTNGVSAPRME